MSIIIETSLLKPVAMATTVARTEPIDLGQFFRTRSGFYVWDSFRERFDLGVVSSVPARSYVASVLKRDASDQSIGKELPAEHLSALVDIAGLIVAQPNGKEGFLLSNGYSNIFYAIGKKGQVFTVRMLWSSDDCRWGIDSFRLDEIDFWAAERQVLCPGTVEL